MSRYADRGVSHQKEDVHNAIAKVDQGLFPSAFCKVVEDHLCGDKDYCIVMHADGAGTKSAIAYMYWKETGDVSVFEGISQDAIVMNTDDLLCVGACDVMLLSNTIGRNAKVIPGEVISTIINSNEKIARHFSSLGVPLITTGGETADVGDLVRTIIVDSTVTCRMRRDEVITNEEMQPGDVIIGLSSTGQTTYESAYNSGIASNGLTMARHELLRKDYLDKFPETSDPNIDTKLVYQGPHSLTDPLEGTPLTIGQAILSPTRTYAPVIKKLLNTYRKQVRGVIHCSGGGQTKCMKFGKRLRYVKDNLFPCPPLFKEIQRCSKASWEEMYQVFNMGHRMEIYGPESLVSAVQSSCSEFKLDCKVVGKIEATQDPQGRNEVLLTSEYGTFHYVAS
ncbi:unnamed protein product [Vitrella brassicaformis CCMP3155]|uniref:phosphoribosylformylglycinamidine cyclo-ligase n=1 Tax=Vitrella brassicaformis (strain CCMP3155) TaxID=1169540 RepID=A0A0G4E955_VITBC|nr:unnamed protein product [Vitrella brassicaformis CCMP3155]|eukprot:CEL92084.1 unnamed protein product [Vitrella brassicaformis CCMP3155]